MFLIFRFNYFLFRDKTSKGKRPANPPETARKETESERKNATRPGVTAMVLSYMICYNLLFVKV